jgi:addiction module HigA family antidote
MNIEPKHPNEHPGRILRRALGKMQTAEAARRMGVSQQRLSVILRGDTGIRPIMALKIGRLTGTEPETWLKLQADYALSELRKRRRVTSALENIAAL